MNADPILDEEAVQWMIQQIENQLASLDLQGWEHLSDRMIGMEVCQRIVEKVMPGVRIGFDIDDGAWEWDTRNTLSRALGILRNQRQIAKYLGPQGPVMPANAMHPVIWDQVSSLWNTQHYGAAVDRAAIFLNAHVQAKTARTDLANKELMNEVFSAKPASPGHPRLRWKGPVGEQTEASMKDGIRNYAAGVMQAIRNPAAHEPIEKDKQVALEELAALSLLARWIDDCEVEWGEGF